MLGAAVVGRGRWGQRLLVCVGTPPSAKLRFMRGVAGSPQRLPPALAAGGLAIGPDYAAALADPAVRAVVLATPHTQHAEQVIAAARAERHVFVEKPFTLDAASARAAVAACREAGVVLALGHN